MSLSLAPRLASPAPAPGRISLPRPVTAVLTDRLDDVAVADTAARTAAARGVPLLLITALPATPATPASDSEARAVLGRVLPCVGRARVGHIAAVHRFPEAPGGPLRAADGLLDLAARHRSPLVFASCANPGGLDAYTLIEAALTRSGPFVHAVPTRLFPSPSLSVRPHD